MQSSEQQQYVRMSRQLDDEILESRVRQEFATCGYSALRQVHVSSRGGCVYLEGQVPSYYLKQLAQVTALRAEGVTWICNELAVSDHPVGHPK